MIFRREKVNLLDIMTLEPVVICPVCRAENFPLDYDPYEQMKCVFCGFLFEIQTCS